MEVKGTEVEVGGGGGGVNISDSFLLTLIYGSLQFEVL